MGACSVVGSDVCCSSSVSGRGLGLSLSTGDTCCSFQHLTPLSSLLSKQMQYCQARQIPAEREELAPWYVGVAPGGAEPSFNNPGEVWLCRQAEPGRGLLLFFPRRFFMVWTAHSASLLLCRKPRAACDVFDTTQSHAGSENSFRKLWPQDHQETSGSLECSGWE